MKLFYYNQSTLVKLLGCFLIIFTISNVTLAQERWNLSFRPGVAIPISKMSGVQLKTGYGMEGSVGYRFMPHFGAYAGWSWNHFASNVSTEFEETGYCFGLQFVHPIKNSKLSYMVKAGALYNHIELENSKGQIFGDTGHGLGFEVEAGVSIPLSKRWNLQPGMRYRSLARDVTVGGTSTSLKLNYTSIGIAASWKF